MEGVTPHFAEPNRTDKTSGNHIPFWLAENTAPLDYGKLSQNIKTDVVIIGGGISGLTTAYCLAKEGKKVVLVEDGQLASGETGRTTAHITYALDDRYAEIEKTFNQETAKLAAESHSAAIEWIAKTVTNHNIDCNFKRVDGYLFLHPTDKLDSLLNEYEATKNAGLPTEFLETTPFIANTAGKCLRFPEQAQFHIIKYITGLAEEIIAAGGQIFTQTHAEEISSKGCKANGYTIEADHIVVATNTPVNDRVTMHTKQWPYRTYVIGAKVPKGKLPYSLWWDTGNMNSQWLEEPYHYVRLEELDDAIDLLIAGGEDHRTGQTQAEDISESERYVRLEEWTRKHLPDMQAVEYKWSGQVMEPLDYLAFIGKNPGEENVYIITGDSGNGITHGTIGGLLLTDLIMGRENPWSKIYDPSRITIKKAGDYLHETGNTIKQYGDWLKPQPLKNANELQAGEGGVLSKGLKKVAVYRDVEGNLHTCTAVCPHMGAILQWNPDEQTFDCPVHGSRFSGKGKVLNGPAANDLESVRYEAEEE